MVIPRSLSFAVNGMKTYSDLTGHRERSGIADQVVEQANRLKARLASVRHIVAIASGKGGVGKSSVTVNLAAALALEGASVGILDADLNGPTIALMLGVRQQQVKTTDSGIVPAVGPLGIKVMSMDLLLPGDMTPVWWKAPSQKDAFAWRGIMETTAFREFLADTVWGTLDYLLIDLPPGTDRLPNLMDVLPGMSGVVIVTIPSGVSHLVIGKSVTMARELLQLRVIGLIENMSAYVCSHCGQKEELFPSGRTEHLAAEWGVPFLGSIPFDPRIATAADDGVLFMMQYGETPAGRTFHQVAARLADEQ